MAEKVLHEELQNGPCHAEHMDRSKDNRRKNSPGNGDVSFCKCPPCFCGEPEEIPLDIVYEDDDLLVVNKPAGMTVHPAAGAYSGTLVNALLFHCRDKLSGIGGVKRPGIVHRIDKETSGLLVVAKNDLAHKNLSEQFAAHSIERTYLAIVYGVPQPLSGTIEGNIGRSATDRKKMALVASGRDALSDVASIRSGGGAGAMPLGDGTHPPNSCAFEQSRSCAGWR